MNIPPSEYSLPPLSDTHTKASLRGGYRGRGRGRGFHPRGRPRGASGGGFSRSLDLRPKSIYIPKIIGTPTETSIREYIISNYADATVETTIEDEKGRIPEDHSLGMIVKFKERYEAEEVRFVPLNSVTPSVY